MKTSFILIYLGILQIIFSDGCFAQNRIIEENRAIARKYIEAWNIHDSITVASLFPDTFLYQDIALNMKTTTNPKLISFVKGTVQGAPDLTFQVNSVIASDTMAMVEWTWKGTFTGGWGIKYPATNKPFTIQGVSVMVIKNGKIIRNFEYYDGDFFRKKTEETTQNK